MLPGSVSGKPAYLGQNRIAYTWMQAESDATMKGNFARAWLIVTTAFVITSLLAGAPADHQFMRDPGMLAGPWEGKSGDDLVGMYLRIHTSVNGSVVYLRDFDVRVDRVVDWDWGWFRVEGKIATWDGRRLRINYNDAVRGRTWIVDLVFDPNQETWSGTFGSDRAVRLERPMAVFDPGHTVGKPALPAQSQRFRRACFSGPGCRTILPVHQHLPSGRFACTWPYAATVLQSPGWTKATPMIMIEVGPMESCTVVHL
jgi:hypothetical protein